MVVRTIRVCVTFATLLSVSIANAASNPTGPEPAPTLADFAQVRDGYIAARDGRCDDVMELLPPVVESDTFWGLPEFVRRGTLEHIVDCAAELQMYDVLITYLYQLIEMPDEDTPYRLRWLVWVGSLTNKPDVAVDALQRLAEFATEDIRLINIDRLTNVYQDILRQDRGDDLRYAFLRTLYEAQYTPPNPFWTADQFMIAYAQMAADRGDTDDLRAIVLRLTQPGYLFQVRIDRRFDAIRQDDSLESFLDLEATAEREIVRLGTLVDQYSNMIRGYIQYSKAFQAARRYEEALEVIEPIALRVRTPGGREDFVDADIAANWALEQYSHALSQVKYAEQSDAMHHESAEMLENQHENVSQRINYAIVQLNYGNFSEALTTAVEMEQVETSEYGRMWVHVLAVCASAMGELERDYSDSLTYLIEHERDNPKALIKAYLCLNDLSAAADILIRRLQSSDQRIVALTSLQYSIGQRNVHDNMKTDLQSHLAREDLNPGHELNHRFSALRDRRDVQEAVNAVGRIEEVSLDPYAWIRY